MQWVLAHLQPEVNSRIQGEIHCIPSPDVSDDDCWLNAFVQDSLFDLDPDLDVENGVPLYYMVAFEQEFDCPERNCVFHTSWSFRFHQVNPNEEESIQSSYDFGCLPDDVESWISSFLEVRFPCIEFDYSSLISGDSLPQLNLYRS